MPPNTKQYACSRLAWHDETATLTYGAAEIRADVQAEWIEAPNYVRLQQPKHALTLLTGGLPWHRRTSRKTLDSLLILNHERQRQFRLGLATDCQYDLKQAARLLNPTTNELVCDPMEPKAGWLYHFSSKNIVIMASEPITNDAGQIHGISFRLLEAEGRRGKLKISCPFPVGTASRVQLDGDYSGPAEHDGTIVQTEFSRNEYFQINIVRAS